MVQMKGHKLVCYDNRSDSSVRILVVDDYKECRELVCMILGKRPNLQVLSEASDGTEAVSKAAELNPDLILLDCQSSKAGWNRGCPTNSGTRPQVQNNIPERRIFCYFRGSRYELGGVRLRSETKRRNRITIRSRRSSSGRAVCPR
jgi:DNA-binding NarL/FixJ family response regulator